MSVVPTSGEQPKRHWFKNRQAFEEAVIEFGDDEDDAVPKGFTIGNNRPEWSTKYGAPELQMVCLACKEVNETEITARQAKRGASEWIVTRIWLDHAHTKAEAFVKRPAAVDKAWDDEFASYSLPLSTEPRSPPSTTPAGSPNKRKASSNGHEFQPPAQRPRVEPRREETPLFRPATPAPEPRPAPVRSPTTSDRPRVSLGEAFRHTASKPVEASRSQPAKASESSTKRTDDRPANALKSIKTADVRSKAPSPAVCKPAPVQSSQSSKASTPASDVKPRSTAPPNPRLAIFRQFVVDLDPQLEAYAPVIAQTLVEALGFSTTDQLLQETDAAMKQYLDERSLPAFVPWLRIKFRRGLEAKRSR